MLKVVTVTANSKKASDVGSRLIRVESASRIKVNNTTGSQFFYPLNDRDSRESPSLLTCSDSVAALITAMNLAYNSVDITLPVFIDNKSDNATVNEVYNLSDIAWGKNAAENATLSLIWVQVGAFEVKKLLVDYTIAEIALLAETGSAS